MDCQIPKLDVAGSSPVSRSIFSMTCGDLPINAITALSCNLVIINDLLLQFACSLFVRILGAEKTLEQRFPNR